MDVLWTYISPTRQGGPAGRKGRTAAGATSYRDGFRSLISTFVQWKLFLALAVCLSPSKDYDTSTRILLELSDGGPPSGHWGPSLLIERLAVKLTRWDAIYFASASQRGHVYEQEWAFSWALSKVTSAVASILILPSSTRPIVRHALAGILVSNITHLLSVIVLYRLVLDILPSSGAQRLKLASTAAFLHTVSPAGVFLSASYGESTFALCNFLGLLSYAWALKFRFSPIADAGLIDAFWTATAGVCFGLSALVRSNGVLSGVIFVLDLLTFIPKLPYVLTTTTDMVRIASLATAGLLVAAGFALPQYVAYQEYCMGGRSRPWCSAFPPSIYSFVQREYWGVGFLRYWTLNNLPLFLLATPMIVLLVGTASSALLEPAVLLGKVGWNDVKKSMSDREATTAEKIFRMSLSRFAVPQLCLALLAVTNFHVQIINRIASGYPLWYLLLAIAIHTPENKTRTIRSGWGLHGRLIGKTSHWLVRGMMIYAIVQGGLYANFLPPA